jgi:hypothetical protein
VGFFLSFVLPYGLWAFAVDKEMEENFANDMNGIILCKAKSYGTVEYCTPIGSAFVLVFAVMKMMGVQ